MEAVLFLSHSCPQHTGSVLTSSTQRKAFSHPPTLSLVFAVSELEKSSRVV